jgi:transcription elongation factor GreA
MSPEVSYLTAEGATRIRSELEFLKGPAREQLSVRLRAAIQQGDLSENADYTAAKEEQGFLEGRIQELEHILRNVVLIDELKQDTTTVTIGSRVTVQEDEYDPETYHLVGPKEADPRNGRISHESPIGKAIIGCHIGEEVQVDTPGGAIRLKIVSIE